MADDSKIFILEMVLPRKTDEANIPAATLDDLMLTLGGKERTEEQFKALLVEAGLELVKIWRLSEALATGCLIETWKK